ncbi:helix-turn-helix transcriptional regulator [Streptomyces sp. NPDC026206]|uniref:helix-turn-helix domain-containing protein n=1 Tax=Streptomyces sp. NPDC026206 TaxID=3157089 RepID=UPI0033C79F49
MPAPKVLDPSSSLTALYGAKLRKLRERAGLTQRQLGEKVHLTHSRIAKIELGVERAPQDVSDRLDEVLDADGDLSDLWGCLNRLPFSDSTRKYMQYEAKSVAIHMYLAHCVPGLLQTEAYAREVMRCGQPWCTADEIEEKVAARIARKGILEKAEAPLLWVVLDEAVIRRPVGGPSVMGEQLEHVLAVSKATNVEIQVLPFAAGAHAALGGSLTLMSFDNGPDMAYLEGDAWSEMVRDRKSVARHSHRYDLVHAAALTPAASVTWLEKAVEELSTCRPYEPT